MATIEIFRFNGAFGMHKKFRLSIDLTENLKIISEFKHIALFKIYNKNETTTKKLHSFF